MELIKFVFSSAKHIFLKAIIIGSLAGFSMALLLAGINHALHNPEVVSLLSAGIFVMTIAAMVILRVKSTVLLTQLTQDTVAVLRKTLCQEILEAPLAKSEQLGSAKLLAALSSDVTSVSTGIMRLPNIFINSSILIGCLAYMLWLSWWLFLCAVCLIATGILIYRIPRKVGLKFYSEARKYNDHLFEHFRAISEGTKELKLHRHRRKEFLEESLDSDINAFSKATVSGTKYYSLSSNFALMIFFAVIGFLTFVVPQFTMIQPEALTGYIIVFLFIQGPLDAIMNALPDLAKTTVSLQKINSLGLNLSLSSNTVNKHPHSHVSEISYKSAIELKRVTHSYYRETEDSHFELGPIDLSFKPGELIFLIGGNGSGKTTLAKLLLGLYKPNQGEVLADGKVIQEDDYDNYRQLFSAVFVDFYLFDELLGFKGIDLDKQAQTYIDKLQLSHKVKVEKGRLSTTNLSQGQRKRLTLLAAYLEDRQFYVFDEWAADQDPEFKRFFYTEILKDLKERGKTVLVISHDEQYFDVADRYIKMDFGQVTVTNRVSELYSQDA